MALYRGELYVDEAAPGLARIVPEGTVLEAVADGFIFTEGPVWMKEDGGSALYFTDIRDDKILRWRPGRGADVAVAPAGHPDGMTLDGENRLIVAGFGARTIWRLEKDGSVTTLCARWHGLKLNSPNDIITRSDESIYFTNPNGGLNNVGMGDYDVQKYIPTQQVLRLALGATEPELLADDFDNPNGICFSPDEAILYVNDTRRKHIRAWDVRPDGSIFNGRLFAETLGTEPGGPDGMRVDVEGNVYCTGPAGIHVFDPAGRLLGRLHTPKQVANMTWGDDDWRTLYMTARETVYRTRLGIPGVPHGPRYRREALAAAGKL